MAKRGNRNIIVTDNLPDIKAGTNKSAEVKTAKNYRYRGTNTGATDRIRNLTGEQVNNMSGPELYETLRTAQRAANANYDRVKKRMGESPATMALDESGGKISVAGMRQIKSKTKIGTRIDKKGNERNVYEYEYTYDVNTMRQELVRAKKYLNYKTGTVKGAKEYEAHIDEMITGYSSLTLDKKKEFWDWVRKFEDKNESLYNVYTSGDSIKDIYEVYVQDINRIKKRGEIRAEEFMEELERRVQKGYEQKTTAGTLKNPWYRLR